MFRVFHGDVGAVCSRLPAASFDACLCDPPYGLGETRPSNSACPRTTSRERTRAGFMGLRWDAGVPGPETWAAILGVLKPGAFLLAFGGTRTYHRLACAIEDAGFEIRDCIMWVFGQGFPKHRACLKPAWEPIVLARKAGRGVLNIDGCRIAAPGLGRWPANVILDPEAAAQLDRQSGYLVSGDNPAKRSADKHRDVYDGWKGAQCIVHRGADAGYASRFFYCAKASRRERGVGNNHPTVKPLKLTEYLARLILPAKGGKLLVPFAGSGSEMLGARRAGWREIVGIEANAQYVDLSYQRAGIALEAA